MLRGGLMDRSPEPVPQRNDARCPGRSTLPRRFDSELVVHELNNDPAGDLGVVARDREVDHR